MEDEKKVSEDKPKTPNKTLLIVEAGVALLAVIVIIVAIVVNKKKDTTVTDPAAETITDPSASAALTGDDPSASADIDNSAVFAYTPQFPEEGMSNFITEDEAKANVDAGTMIRLEISDGNYIYVNNYRDNALLQEALSFDDTEMEQYIKDEILAQYEVKIPVARDTAEMGDLANIDYAGFRDGVQFEGGTAQGYDLLLGSGSFIPGFEDGVVGMKIGETKDIPLTFPENYGNSDLAGASVTFTVTLNGLSVEGFAQELTDDVAKQLTGGEMATAAEFNNYIRTDYLPKVKLNEFLMTDLYVGNLSEETLRAEYDKEVDQYIQSSSTYGMSLASYVGMMGVESLEDFLNDIAMSTPDTVRAEALYEALRDNEVEEVTDAEIDELAAQQGYTDTSEFLEMYGYDTIADYLYSVKIDDYLNKLAGIPAE